MASRIQNTSTSDSARERGVVKWFSQSREYGFIVRPDGAGDVFLHGAKLNDTREMGDLVDGQIVEYEIASGEKPDSIKAVRVRVIYE